MNIELKDISDTRKTLTVSLDKAEVEQEYKNVVGEFVRMAKIPGFRPGKVPPALVVKKFPGEVRDEFRQKVVGRAYRDGIKEAKLDVVEIVKVDEGTVENGQSSAITFTLDIQPEFEVKDYQGIPTAVRPTDPSDEDIQRVIDGLREERADFKVVERPAVKGDYVRLSYEGMIDGKPVVELVADRPIFGKSPQVWEEVEGAEGLIPGLGAGLAGMKPGDKKEVPVEFPAGFHVEPLAGRNATYSIEIQEVRERVLPEIDENFLKAHQVETLEQLQEQVRSNLKMRLEAENRAEQRRQITEALQSKVAFVPPEGLVREETDGVLRQMMEQNLRRGVPQEELEQKKEELYANARQAAESRVRMRFILLRIAEQEKIEVGERDFQAWLLRESMRSNTPVEKIGRELRKNQSRVRAIRQSLLLEKSLDFLVDKATVTTEPAKA